MVKFQFRKKRKGFFDIFKPSQKISVTCRETLLSRLGIGRGFKTKIGSDEDLAYQGEARKIADILTDSNGKRVEGVTYPLQLPIERLSELRNYEIKIFGKWRPINNRTIEVLDAVYDYMNSIGDRKISQDEFDEGLYRRLERRFG